MFCLQSVLKWVECIIYKQPLQPLPCPDWCSSECLISNAAVLMRSAPFYLSHFLFFFTSPREQKTKKIKNKHRATLARHWLRSRSGPVQTVLTLWLIHYYEGCKKMSVLWSPSPQCECPGCEQLASYSLLFQRGLTVEVFFFLNGIRKLRAMSDRDLSAPLPGYKPLPRLMKVRRARGNRPLSDGDLWAVCLSPDPSAHYRGITDHNCLKVYHKDPAQAFSHGARPANGDARVSEPPRNTPSTL